jgi:DUF4097 and DUF4098 domain-containing protein YvlB
MSETTSQVPETIMQTFATPAPISAVLDIAAGRIQIIAADRADTTVEVRPADPAKGRDQKAAEHTTVEFADGVLRIRTAEPKNQYFGPSGSLEVTVQLPTGSGIQANTASCELRGVGRLGDVVFEGAYRQIKIDEAASVRLTAVDGDVEVGRLGGPAQITTARGAIRIAEAARGAVVLRTQMGDITVGAAPGVSASLDAGTGHGRVSNALKNDGTTELDIRATTGQGDITARSL